MTSYHSVTKSQLLHSNERRSYMKDSRRSVAVLTDYISEILGNGLCYQWRLRYTQSAGRYSCDLCLCRSPRSVESMSHTHITRSTIPWLGQQSTNEIGLREYDRSFCETYRWCPSNSCRVPKRSQEMHAVVLLPTNPVKYRSNIQYARPLSSIWVPTL